tara:strand:- start:63 stop:626 length:564 start_codon:yes stop_codon:yes gene_type:complete
MNLFKVEKISYYSPNKGYAIKLIGINNNLKFSILINSFEAQSIALVLEGIQTDQPLIYDVVLDILSKSNIHLEKVEIYKSIEETLYSKLHISSANIKKEIDCRPIDAISISLRFGCPIDISDQALNNIESKEIILDSCFSSIKEYKKQNTSKKNIEKLNHSLSKAINEENYEIAAKLRDEINSLNSK